jgi:hypothetical protein
MKPHSYFLTEKIPTLLLLLNQNIVDTQIMHPATPREANSCSATRDVGCSLMETEGALP